MTHWKKLTNPDYLGVYALEDGKDIIATIQYIRQENVIGTDGKKEECPIAHFSESIKPMILNATNMKTITKISGSPYIEKWAGLKIQIGSERVKAFGEIVDALRVRDKKVTTEPEAPILCEVCNKPIAPAGSMTIAQTAAYTAKKYGKALCAECAVKAKTASDDAQRSEHDS